MDMKVKAIEKVDHLVGLVFSAIRNMDVHLVISADHATPVSFKDHTGDPVPCVFWGRNVVKDDVSSYSERSCYKGGLHRIKGIDIMPILMNLSGHSEKYGA
jgi:2,3-bisphosphoglycerate-independent phosphoglycerate mutase